MQEPTGENFDPQGFDPESEMSAIEADVKELTHECKVCSSAGLLMMTGYVEDLGQYQVWYCQDHVDQLVADAAFSAALENDSGEGNRDTTRTLAIAYLRHIGWSDERIASGLGDD